jgi:hypothetical protein
LHDKGRHRPILISECRTLQGMLARARDGGANS